ncbi:MULTISPECIES: hypothetical protein [unclassified Neisseria]|uniref:hypothetical protein n=1 Tax=unclassified Neisseria TaxID=2623750 RepID=UPI0026664C00|nr:MULTISPECIES: hypothetical protein [unclassified Neisseria]MDO1508875.1 hypothetical protein [Neisseria sp. MVDL19-042950]MDO1515134.1 hypothetical protein [Neisseria sp. MVDL18-041461]MDO1562494.1 hypothetical protein [Neisseria sp. MVDL20-010259]
MREPELFLTRVYKPLDSLDFNGEKLKIDEKEIKFLHHSILNNSEFTKDARGNWKLIFFKDDDLYRQEFYIKFNELDKDEDIAFCQDDSSRILKNTDLNFKKYDEITRLCFVYDGQIQGDSRKDHQINDEFLKYIEHLSLIVRESKAVKFDDFYETRSHYGHFDGRGLSFLAKLPKQRAYLERYILLVALAYAYLGVLEKFGNELAKLGKPEDISRLHFLYEKISYFYVKFFFCQPVLSKNSASVEAWNRISGILKISELKSELDQKVSMIHYILNLQSEKQERKQKEIDKKKQDKVNITFVILGVAISCLQLIGLFK